MRTLFPIWDLRASGFSMLKTDFLSGLISTIRLPSFTHRRAQSGFVGVYFPAEARARAHPESEIHPTNISSAAKTFEARSKDRSSDLIGAFLAYILLSGNASPKENCGSAISDVEGAAAI